MLRVTTTSPLSEPAAAAELEFIELLLLLSVAFSERLVIARGNACCLLRCFQFSSVLRWVSWLVSGQWCLE